jgi:hypothetical protein
VLCQGWCRVLTGYSARVVQGTHRVLQHLLPFEAALLVERNVVVRAVENHFVAARALRRHTPLSVQQMCVAYSLLGVLGVL